MNKTKSSTFFITPITLIIMTICFGFNSSEIDGSEIKTLDTMVKELDSLDDYSIHLIGHTDNAGTEVYNESLSKQRALAVRNYLISQNVDSTKITIEYVGETQPFLPNTSEENRTQNRRVEVSVSGQKKPSKEITEITIPQPIEVSVQEQDDLNEKIVPVKNEAKKKKKRRHLVWTGWRTGFHWSTSGK